VGLANVFVSGALILMDPSLRALAIFGFVVIGVFAFLTLTPARQVRLAAEAADDHAALPANPH